MSEEEKKAIENFKSFIKEKDREQEILYQNEEYYKDDIEQNELFLKMLHSIENLIEKQNKEIEQLKNLNKHQSKDITKAVDYTFELNKELEIKDKMIEEMTKYTLVFDKNGLPIPNDQTEKYFRKKVENE